MDKETWKSHIESEGVIRPSHGGDLNAWKDKVVEHLERQCGDCNDRRRTRSIARNARMRHDALTSCGLVRVKGALGGIYYE